MLDEGQVVEPLGGAFPRWTGSEAMPVSGDGILNERVREQVEELALCAQAARAAEIEMVLDLAVR